jgi:hypothetical protein
MLISLIAFQVHRLAAGEAKVQLSHSGITAKVQLSHSGLTDLAHDCAKVIIDK